MYIIGKASRSSLTLKNNCICPGYTLIFAECTVDGGPGDSTVWKGSAFDCSSNDIPLVHSRFASSPKAAGECNNGSIEAHGLRVQDNCYTSQLNISVTPNLIGKTIKCVHDNLTAEIVVGTLRVTTVGETKIFVILVNSTAFMTLSKYVIYSHRSTSTT